MVGAYAFGVSDRDLIDTVTYRPNGDIADIAREGILSEFALGEAWPPLQAYLFKGARKHAIVEFFKTPPGPHDPKSNGYVDDAVAGQTSFNNFKAKRVLKIDEENLETPTKERERNGLQNTRDVLAAKRAKSAPRVVMVTQQQLLGS